MRDRWKTAAKVIALAVLFLLVLGFMELKGAQTEGGQTRVWHHELAADGDPTIGSDVIPEDFMVDDTFCSHLPLVILDTEGEEIVNYKYYDRETDSFVVPKEVDPYVNMKISVIDQKNHINHLGDSPSLASSGKIKIRGNTSSASTYPKKQYLIKLLTEDGEKNRQEIMGMSSSDTWILNGTQMDRSYLRNYIAMNTGGELDPYTPDMRFCEVVMQTGDGYEYLGLYGMYEKVQQGEGRVELQKAEMEEGGVGGSYLLRRDRKEKDGKYMEVWSTRKKRFNNWINLEYPSSENITEAYWQKIQSDIQAIEEILYESDRNQFEQYKAVLDVDSFVDYFIINEFFANYDGGWNSTFLYKDVGGKLSIGPFWDFDNAMDNYREEKLSIRELAFYEAPWFDRLVTDEDFVERVEARYRELRKTILSREVLEEKLDQACVFLEKPIKRDLSRWQELYTLSMDDSLEKETGLLVERNPGTWEGEVQRIKDVLWEHGDYMDKNLETKLKLFVEWEKIDSPDGVSGLLALIFIAAFFVSVVLVQRMRRGE